MATVVIPSEARCVLAWSEEIADGEYRHFVGWGNEEGEYLADKLTVCCYSADEARACANEWAGLAPRVDDIIDDDLMRWE